MTDRIETIAIFVAVAELQSFAEAARRLNRTSAAVTRAVAALEADLMIRLLNRTTRSVALTEEGARYLEVCRRLLAVHDELRGMESAAPTPPHGILKVTAPEMFGRLHVMPSVARFLAAYPLIDVCALLLDRVVSLIDEGIDVGVRLGQLPDSSMRALRVGEVYRAVYASPDYLTRHGAPATPHELGNHAVVSCTPLSPIPDRWSFDGARGVANVAVRPRVVVNSTAAAADAAASGIGLTYLASYQTADHVQTGRLVRVLAEYEPPPIPIHVVWPSGNFVPTKVRLFIDHIAEDLRRSFHPSRA